MFGYNSFDPRIRKSSKYLKFRDEKLGGQRVFNRNRIKNTQILKLHDEINIISKNCKDCADGYLLTIYFTMKYVKK